jgi:hypothetical protein
VNQRLRDRIRERLAVEYRGALRAARERTETAFIGWCSGFLIAGSLVVMFIWPSEGEGRWLLAIGAAGALLALRRDYMRLWKAWWKKRGSE